MGRAVKGTVKVEADKGWLRLRWSWAGRRFVLAIGLPDEGTNRAIAQRKAAIIEADIKAEVFDPTLARYKAAVPESGLEVVELFERYRQFKAKNLDSVSLEKYRATAVYLQQFFRQRSADWVTEEMGFEFRDWISERLAPITARERICLIRSCWQWGMKRGLVKSNPWLEVKVKVPPKQKPRPFNKEEVEKILEGFRTDKDYSYYTDFVEFLLAVGCRPGEAIGLRWQHLSDDCSVVWIGESLSRGRRRATKTNRDRQFELTPRIQALLLARRPEKWKPDDLVFPSKRGKSMDDKNFCKRAWVTVLEKVGVTYRKPYNSRHTFVSQAMDAGLSPGEIAGITGHTEETLFRSYLGSVRGRPKLPELRD
jgi:integrase